MGTAVQFARYPVLDISPKCLPNGKQMVTVKIDFTQLTFQGTLGIAQNFPWVNSVNALSGLYALVTTPPYGNSQQPLSEIKSMLYHVEIGMSTNPETGANDHLWIYNYFNGQTYGIGLVQQVFNTSGVQMVDGAVPFYHDGTSNIAFFAGYRAQTFTTFPMIGSFTFCNFEVQPFTFTSFTNIV